MIPPPLPPDESERLASLRALGLLDTEAEERFDRITHLARVLFDVPIVLISLVDADRQWFKSRQGLQAKETAREVSFCGHAILGAEIFEIPDATADARFRDNPLVSGAPDVRFYAGAPLSAPDGHRIGTLCLVDRKPRQLTQTQRQVLKELAVLVEHEIAASAPGEAPALPGASAAETARRASRDRMIMAGFGAAVAVLLGAAAVSFHEVRALVRNSRGVARAHVVLRNLEGVVSEAKAAKPDARGASERLAELRRLLSDDPEQLRRLDAVERPAPGRAAGALDAEIGEMKAAENALLAERSASVDSGARVLIVVASLSRGVGALVVVLVFFAVRRFIREREEAEAALVEARDAALRDANARRQAQEETRRLSERLRAVLDQVDSGVILIDANGTISIFNLAAERIHGAWRDEIERVMRAGAHPPMRPDGITPLPPDEDPMARALKGESVRDALIFLRTPFRPNGYLISASAAPLRSPQGPVTGAVLVFREVAGSAMK